MGAASAEEAASVIHSAVELLLKRMLGLRFLVPIGRLAPLWSVQSAADVDFRWAEPHDHLELPRTYHEFLAKLGPRTRRNFRYYRRRSELAGNEFISDQAFPDFCSAARRLFPKAAYGTDRRKFERCLAMIKAMPSHVLVGLRRKDGEWIGLAGGWHLGDRTILVAQLNDRAYGRDSISSVLRSYLIESLIDRGTRELVFWGQSSSPLCWYCTSPEIFAAYIDSRSLPWRLFRRACAMVRKLAPRNSGKWLDWIVLNEGAEVTQLRGERSEVDPPKVHL
jgi:Acetyltransferase (GNAT) domain